VGNDFKSFTSGKEECTVIAVDGNVTKIMGHIPHDIGTKVSMERADCNADRNQTCSRGLHFCSFDYLGSYHSSQGRVIIIKINPRDVTAIPNDYNDTKGRCCKLEVVGEVPEAEAKGHFPSVVEKRYTAPGWSDNVIEPARGNAESPPIIEDKGKMVLVDIETIDPLHPNDFVITFTEVVGTEPMTVKEATKLGRRDGEDQAEEDTDFSCDPFSGEHYSIVPVGVDGAYLLAFCTAYADTYFIDSERWDIQGHGYTDGARAATKDKGEQRFSPYPATEKIERSVSNQRDIYSKGFLLGYINVWAAR